MVDGCKPGFSNGLLVSLEHLDVVHVGLPVLHVAAVVRRQHPHVVVRPGHGSDRTVVGLRGGGHVRFCSDASTS